jgi:hypothetical protein
MDVSKREVATNVKNEQYKKLSKYAEAHMATAEVQVYCRP